MSDPSVESEIRNHAWAYFSLHAQQRMSVFQFFITLETALFGVAFLAVQFAKPLTPWFSITGLMITLLAFVFWKIDQRTRDLIGVAECCLMDVEAYLARSSTLSTRLPFSSDPQHLGTMATFPLLPGRLSYSKCFGVVFLCCALLGIATFAWLLKYA
jgi:hypothetical protein